jgi:predicted ribosome quality control (RQC) complex YloA/Tae2 family protein
MLLSQEGVIIEVIKRVAPSKNRYRMILPRQLYVAPPPQDKRNFNLESPDSFSRLFDGLRDAKSDSQLWQTLVSNFAGVSPQLGREIAYRLAEKKGQTSDDITLASFQRWDVLYGEMRTLLQPLNPYTASQVVFHPSIVRDEEGSIVAFAPYELHQFRAKGIEPQKIESVSQGAEEFYAQTEDLGGQAQRKQQIAASIADHQDKLRRRLASLEGSLKKAESADELRRKGEAIYAHLYEVEKGATTLEAEGLVIKLDPDRSASENAQDYFREYNKSRQALDGVPELVQETRYELEYLDEMLTQLELAETYEEVVNIKAELAENDYGPKSTPKEREKAAAKAIKKPSRVKRRKLPHTPSFVSPDGFTIFVGKSAQHNEYVTFDLGDKSDVWLHARGMPGSHVIIKTIGREVPEATLQMAAELAAFYSKGQQSTKVEVTYTPQKFVRKVKGQHPGLVTYTNDKSLAVKPQRHGPKK